jgi:hypothetical protein
VRRPGQRRVHPAVQNRSVSGDEGLPRPARMPFAVRLFLGYALLILALIGLSLRIVVDQAIAAPVSPIGVVVMALLAYTIFTTTLVVQRKEAARGLAIGLATLTLPGIPLVWFTFANSALGLILAALMLALAVALLRGLSGSSTRAWLNEP